MRLLHIFFISILFSFILSSCKSSKLSDSQIHYILWLRSDKDLTHLNETYEEYNITDVKRSSKTQYQYRASFTCKVKDCKELEEVLASDNKVLEYEIVPHNIGEVETSKGSKVHHTRPIGSQGRQ